MTGPWRWGLRSRRVRGEIHPDLARLADRVLDISPIDVALTEGHRGKPEQDFAVLSGKSQLVYPNSAHNKIPSGAMHLDPYPIDYGQPLRYYVLCGVVWCAAKQLGMTDRIRWGGDWDRDFNFGEESFRDLAHWELVDTDDRSAA